MKAPRGFAKNYFTFASIQAHSVAPKLASRTTSHLLCTQKNVTIMEEESEYLASKDSHLTLCELNTKPCLCNYYYSLRTKIALLINHYIPRCPYYTVCFAFRRSGVHPPFSFLKNL